MIKLNFLTLVLGMACCIVLMALAKQEHERDLLILSTIEKYYDQHPNDGHPPILEDAGKYPSPKANR